MRVKRPELVQKDLTYGLYGLGQNRRQQRLNRSHSLKEWDHMCM